jgi:hypothetical protein
MLLQRVTLSFSEEEIEKSKRDGIHRDKPEVIKHSFKRSFHMSHCLSQRRVQ